MTYCRKECKCYWKYTDCLGKSIGRCAGTKEIDACNCGGDESKCDFYPDKRLKARKPTLSDITQELLENKFELTIRRYYTLQDTVRVSVRDEKTGNRIENCIKCADNTFFNYEEALLEMIYSMIYELKGE